MEDPAGSVLDAIFDSLQVALHYRFQDPTYLALALAALVPPLTPETAAARQRLEFLGDAAWNYAVAAQAFRAWRRGSAGELTRLRASCCSTRALARLARRVGLPSPLGSGERVPAEMLEAILGAMVEDGGLEPVLALAKRVITAVGSGTSPPPVDPKSALQMLLQAHSQELPTYRLLERRGPAHHPIFRIRVTATIGAIDIRGDGEGSSRQAAEQEAARRALDQLGRTPPATSQNPETQHVVGGFPESHQA